MNKNDIAVTPRESTVELKAMTGAPFIIEADGSIGIRRESIPLLIMVLAQQLAGQHVCGVSELRYASAALKALETYLG